MVQISEKAFNKFMKFKFPIAWKLLLVTVFILLLAMIPVALQLSGLFSELSLKREEDVNKEQTLSKSSEIVSKLEDILDKSFVIGSLLYREQEVLKDAQLVAVNKQAINFNLERLRDIYRVVVYKMDPDSKEVVKVAEILNSEILIRYKIPLNFHKLIDEKKPFPNLIPFNDNVTVRNRTVSTTTPLLTIGSPLVKENGAVSHIVVTDFAFSSLQKTLNAQEYRTIHIVDEDANTVAHSNLDESKEIESYNSGLRKENILKAIDSKIHTGQTYFTTENGDGYYGAYAKTPFGLTVFSETSEAVITEPAKLARKQVFLITSIVFFASLLIIWIFSNHLTRPIADLSRLMFSIGEGKFNIKAKQIITSNDEVGDLAHWFDHMVDGLKERDRVKQLFAKFQGTQIAEDLLSEDFDQSAVGKEKDVVVLFSDIRNFTQFSDKKDPAQVVSMLNEYFTAMVSIVSVNYGVVDKFIGDAIMAVWGAPKSTERDAYYAVRSCLEMREALIILNKKRQERGEVALEMGIGLHYGKVVAGTIGTSDRMEYTVIGDTVNIASRLESETKNYKTDLIVSEQLIEQVKNDFTFKKIGDSILKGKDTSTPLYTIERNQL